MATEDVGRWTKVRTTLGLIWDFVVLGPPIVWTLRGQVSLTWTWPEWRAGIVNLHYYPAGRYTKTEEQFLRNVAQFSARAMDRFFRHEYIAHVNVMVSGQIPLEDGSDARKLKKAKLVLNKERCPDPSAGSLRDIAKTNPQQFLDLCSFQWV